MSKELEALKIIGELYLVNDEQVKDWDKRNFNILKSALQRLEAINNSNLSEALECLEQFINEMTRCLENPKEYVKGYEKQIFWKYKNTLETTIKQALLKAQELEKENAELRQKAQEPKHYLKWEDLDFTKDTKCQKAKMNDKEYTLHYFILYDNHKEVIIQDNDGSICTVCNEKFFNDLYLESVE